LVGKKPIKTNSLVSQNVQTTAGINAHAHGKTSNFKLFSQHNFTKIFHGSENHGAPASETNQTSSLLIKST
jgi:hypothetical protein